MWQTLDFHLFSTTLANQKINCIFLLLSFSTYDQHIFEFKWFICEVAQLCPILCNPMDCRPPGSSIHAFSRQEYWSGLPFLSPGDLPNPGIKPRSPALQADALRSATRESLFIPKVKVKSLSRVWLFATPSPVAYQASWSMGFSSREYWSGLPFPYPGDLPDQGLNLGHLYCRQVAKSVKYKSWISMCLCAS